MRWKFPGKRKVRFRQGVPSLIIWAVLCGEPMSDRNLQSQEEQFARERQAMVERQIVARGVTDPLVLGAMKTVPRHEFVKPVDRQEAYRDGPLPIGQGQTISQPYIVALMSELMRLQGGERVLEIGTGSGYQTAVLAAMGMEVYSIEIVPALCERARGILKNERFARVHLRCGDGYQGWPDAAPFDAIMITAAPPDVPPPLLDQLKIGGRLVLPVGDDSQELFVLTKHADHIERERIIAVRFVPMTGEAQKNIDGR